MGVEVVMGVFNFLTQSAVIAEAPAHSVWAWFRG